MRISRAQHIHIRRAVKVVYVCSGTWRYSLRRDEGSVVGIAMISCSRLNPVSFLSHSVSHRPILSRHSPWITTLVVITKTWSWQGAHSNRHGSTRHRHQAWNSIRPRQMEQLGSGREVQMVASRRMRCSLQKMDFGRQKFGGRKLEKGYR